MTKIICDQFGIHSACEEDFIVKEAIDYENALNLMKQLKKEAIHNKEQPEHDKLQIECNIVVRNPAIFHWFDSPARQFDCQIIKLYPVIELKRLIKQSNIPANLNKHPQWIVELGLLDKAKNQSILPNENSLMWLQRVLIDEIWQYENLDKNNDFDFNISNLIYWLSTHKKSELHPFVKTLIIDQLEVWGKNHPDKADLFKWLADDPFFRAKLIIWEQSLQNYPASQIVKWFQHDNIWYTLNLFPTRKKSIPEIIDLQKESQLTLTKDLQLPESIAIFVKIFLEEQWTQSPQEALSFIYGLMEVERLFLLQKLHSYLQQGISLEKDVYDKISRLKQIPEVIDLAQQLVLPQIPSSIPASASVETIQQWLRDEYLPFYRSSALLKKLELTIPHIDSFEEWLKKSYQDLLISGKGMAYSQIYKLKPRLAESPVLIYLFDGLDYLSAKEELLPAFESMGAYPENDVVPYLAFLPTETFIAKPSLVCGLMNSQIMPEQPDAMFYRKLLQDSLCLNEDEIRSATDKDATIEELIQEPAKAYLFLDNQLDREYLHSGLSPYVRLKKYAAHLKQQARAIVEAAKFIKEQYNKNLFVSICSDHGYTELPQIIPIINVQSTKKTKARSIFSADIAPTTIAAANIGQYADEANSSNTWKLKSGLFGLNEGMTIPLRYGCFEKRPKGATHGGCTPQELAVPWFSITFQKPEPAKPPIVSLEGEIFCRKKENELIVIISNINSYPISITALSIENKTGVVELLTTFPVHIEQKQVVKLEASFNAIAVNDNMLELKVFCTFTQRHEKAKIETLLIVETKGAMTNEFDDEFEF